MEDIFTLAWILIFSFILYNLPKTKYSDYFYVSLIFGIIQGISIILFPLKIEIIYGFLLILLSVIIGYNHRTLIERNGVRYEEGLLHTILGDEKFFFMIPLLGLILLFFHSIVITFYFNKRMGLIDELIILQAFAWILYNYMNTQYFKEKDFLFLFLNFLAILFLLPALVVYLIEDSYQDSYTWSSFVNILLAEPLGLLLNKLGYVVVVDNDMILYQDTVSGVTTRLWIAKGCSGINSVIIFLSAYIAYLISNKNLKSHMVVLVMSGILISYLANLLRMVIIVIIGHYYGIEALIWTHKNIGWIIFTAWLFIFWKISNYFESEISKNYRSIPR